MHFEWSCALKATGLLLGGCVAIVGVMFAIIWIAGAIGDRTHNATGGVAKKVGQGVGIGILSLMGLFTVCVIWYECYKAVCPMAMHHTKAAPAVAAKP